MNTLRVCFLSHTSLHDAAVLSEGIYFFTLSAFIANLTQFFSSFYIILFFYTKKNYPEKS